MVLVGCAQLEVALVLKHLPCLAALSLPTRQTDGHGACRVKLVARVADALLARGRTLIVRVFIRQALHHAGKSEFFRIRAVKVEGTRLAQVHRRQPEVASAAPAILKFILFETSRHEVGVPRLARVFDVARAVRVEGADVALAVVHVVPVIACAVIEARAAARRRRVLGTLMQRVVGAIRIGVADLAHRRLDRRRILLAHAVGSKWAHTRKPHHLGVGGAVGRRGSAADTECWGACQARQLPCVGVSVHVPTRLALAVGHARGLGVGQ